MAQPQVSIITALHNKEDYVEATILSVLAQTMTDWEMIVVENGSTDNGEKIVRQFSDIRIRLVISSKCGPGTARNVGLGMATGNWILFLDADDLIEPEHLAVLLQMADKKTEADVVAGGWKEFSNDNPEKFVIHHPATFGFSHTELLARAIALAPWVLHAAIVKRHVLIKQNGWPEQLDAYPDEDTAFWFSVLLESQVAWVGHWGALYRRFTNASRSESGNALSRVEGYSKIIEHNFLEAERMGIKILPKCYGIISMMFEVSYRKAIANKERAAAKLALVNATIWLKKCPEKCWNIRMRQWFGIAIVNDLKRALQSGEYLHRGKISG